jgi:hypothetical protein
MDDGFRSKHSHHDRFGRASFDRRCSLGTELIFRNAENSSKGPCW